MLKSVRLRYINTNLAISNLFYIFVYIIKKNDSYMELDLNTIHSKREIARFLFPQHNERYAWSLIVMLCKDCRELTGLFTSNRRYVLPSELKKIISTLNSDV